jgi:hypothetical protein
MKTTMQIASLLLLSAVVAAPASANYFSNPKTNTQLNIGSAKSPTPEMLRAGGTHLAATGPVMGSAEDQDLADEGLPQQSAYSGHGQQAFIQHAQIVTFTNVKLIGMEGKPLMGSDGKRLGRILAVDQTNRLIQVQMPSGIAVSMSSDLVHDRGKFVTASTTSKKDIMAMAKTQTGRTVALDLGVKGRAV